LELDLRVCPWQRRRVVRFLRARLSDSRGREPSCSGGNMKLINAFIPAAFLGLALAVPGFAQEMNSPAAASSPSAGESMNQAGKEMKSAGSDTWSAAKDTGQGTATAVRDTKITAKVKRALHNDEATKSAD